MMMIRRQISGYDIWTFEFISFYMVRGTLRRMTPVMVYSLFHVHIQVYWFLHLFYLIFFSMTLCLNISHISCLCCIGTVYYISILYYLFISSPFQQKLQSRLSFSGQLCYIVGFAVRTWNLIRKTENAWVVNKRHMTEDNIQVNFKY